MSDEASISRVGETLNQTLEADREGNVARDHFSPVQVRFPVNAPALRPPAAVEEVVEEHAAGGGVAIMVANYDQEDKADGEKAQDLARGIKVEFMPDNIKFWFAQLEDEMEMAGIGRQWLKKAVVQRNLPNKQKEDVMGLLSLGKAEAGPHIYLDIKRELMRIYAPKPQDAYNKALTRTMTGLPSQLGYKLVNDVCKKPTKFDNCCCAAHVLALWSNQLPVNIRAHISDKVFTKETYKEVFEAADKVFNSSKQIAATRASQVAATELDETLPAFNEQNQPTQTAAMSRGGGRGGRGGRGNGRNQNQNSSSSGTGRGGQGNRGQGSNRGGRGRGRGPRHASSPPEECCDRHWVHGPEAYFCLKPLTCPWKNKVIARD